METLTIRLFADVVHAYSRGILRGVADFSKMHGRWNITFHSLTDSEFTRNFAQDHVRGVVMQIRNREQADKLAASGVPAVNVSNVLTPPAQPAVFPDDVATGRLAATYFLDRGFKNFAYFGYPAHRYSEERMEGFVQTITKAGYECTIFPRSGERAPTPEGERRERREVLATLPQPLAAFCRNDACAKETVKDAIELGLLVPDQIAVLGVDNDEINCELSGVQLSSIRLNTEQIGYEAASLLAKLIAGQAPPAEPILIPPIEVITRRSTDVLALADVEVAAAVRFIRDRGGREINVEDLLERTSLSRRSLEMRFRKALGRSPYQEIRRVQIERAQLLLSRTDRPVGEIADACGFKEARQLSTAFHDRIGLTPRQYRRRARRDPQTPETQQNSAGILTQ
ncbi:MAG: XylR family transcriptional regulator [Planctomycetota bacterium]|nr:XylR family transcriptional regulator [Planctomycetota bacterium]